MNAFQSRLLTIIEHAPGINRKELALALGLSTLNANRSRYLRWLENTGCIISKRVKERDKCHVKIYRVKHR